MQKNQLSETPEAWATGQKLSDTLISGSSLKTGTLKSILTTLQYFDHAIDWQFITIPKLQTTQTQRLFFQKNIINKFR